MQTLVSMLESKEPIKITTAELAKRCEITEAAIYKHFPSKRKIYEGLVDFCEENIFPRISSIKKEVSNPETPFNICTLILAFCEKNKGICKILTREVLTPDEIKIEEKVNHLFERFELEIKLAFQNYEQSSKAKFNLTPTDSAGLIISILEGKIQSFVRSNFKRKVLEEWNEYSSKLMLTIYK
tara:strand:- start:2621 stop:3169 length:549 start_codon:yes stop_codon:yes gene_type:complete